MGSLASATLGVLPEMPALEDLRGELAVFARLGAAMPLDAGRLEAAALRAAECLSAQAKEFLKLPPEQKIVCLDDLCRKHLNTMTIEELVGELLTQGLVASPGDGRLVYDEALLTAAATGQLVSAGDPEGTDGVNGTGVVT